MIMITVIRLRTYSCHSSSDQLRNYGAPADLQCTVSEIQTHCLKVFLSARDSGLFCNFLLFWGNTAHFLWALYVFISIYYINQIWLFRDFSRYFLHEGQNLKSRYCIWRRYCCWSVSIIRTDVAGAVNGGENFYSGEKETQPVNNTKYVGAFENCPDSLSDKLKRQLQLGPIKSKLHCRAKYPYISSVSALEYIMLLH